MAKRIGNFAWQWAHGIAPAIPEEKWPERAKEAYRNSKDGLGYMRAQKIAYEERQKRALTEYKPKSLFERIAIKLLGAK